MDYTLFTTMALGYAPVSSNHHPYKIFMQSWAIIHCSIDD